MGHTSSIRAWEEKRAAEKAVVDARREAERTGEIQESEAERMSR